MKQGRSYGESKGANSACGFVFHARFAHAAYHCFNSDTLSTKGLCFVIKVRESKKMKIEKSAKIEKNPITGLMEKRN